MNIPGKTKYVRYIPIIILVLPCVLLLVTMMFYPVYQTVRFSLAEVKLPSLDMEFIGLANFVDVFSDTETYTGFRNTLVWIFGVVLMMFLLGFWAAMTFSVNVRGGIFFRIVCMIPWITPSIVSSNLWRWIFNTDLGLLNATATSFGMESLRHNWLGDPNTALFSVMIAAVWRGFPFVMIMLLAGLQGIPRELYEQGEIDGANRVQLFRYITIPSLKSIIVIVLILQTIFQLNAFDFVYVMTGGGPAHASEVLGLMIFRMGFEQLDFGAASAVSVGLILMGVVFYLIYRFVILKTADWGNTR